MLDAVARLDAPSVSTVAEKLTIPVATAHRICGQLQRLGYLQRLPGTRRWTVASPLVELSANVLRSAATSAAANAVLQSLAAQLGEMCSFAVQVGNEVVYIASAESRHNLTISFRAGRAAPLFCTSSGRLFLSRITDPELARYLKLSRRPAYTRYTVTDVGKLTAIIHRIRSQGYAITSQEYILHVVGAAVPVLGADGAFYGALSVAAPDVRLNGAQLKKMIPTLKQAAKNLASLFSDRHTSSN